MKRDNRHAAATLDRSGNRGPSVRDLIILATVASVTIIYVSYIF